MMMSNVDKNCSEILTGESVVYDFCFTFIY